MPIFQLSEENMRVESPTDPVDEHEIDHEDPDNPSEPVMDRETIKKNARLLLKKKTNANRRPPRKTGKGGGGGGGGSGGGDDDDDARAASPGRPTTEGGSRPASPSR